MNASVHLNLLAVSDANPTAGVDWLSEGAA